MYTIDTLFPKAPFDFQTMLQRTLSRPNKLMVVDEAVPSYTRAIWLKTRVVPVKVTAQGTVDEPKLLVETTVNLSPQERLECLRIVRKIFSVDIDLDGFIKQMSRDALWSGLIHKFYGLRPILDGSLFESMARAIVGQQLNVHFAATLVERVVDLAGMSVSVEGNDLPVFPSPERIAAWDYDKLRELSFSQRKAEYLIDFARTVVSGDLVLDDLNELADDEVMNKMKRLRGIGPWTIECLLLFGLGRQDILPTADIGVLKAVERLYQLPQRPTQKELAEMASAWAPWRSYATYYLWYSILKKYRD